MIPRLKPYLGKEELLTIFKKRRGAVENFERAFAKQFNIQHAIAFPYGRSALWAFLNAFNIKNAEVVQPAYTCSVVAHATVLSENIPVFVDCNLTDYNMDLDQFKHAITQNTRVVVPTHLFGYPLNINQVQKIVTSAEQKFGHKIWVIQDCAHSFNAKFKGKSVIKSGDGAIFGLGISKQITSIFGGMFTSNNEEVAQKVRDYRNRHFKTPSKKKALLRFLYLAALYPAFNPLIYRFVYWLQEKTPFLNRLTKAYHLDKKIHFPPDYLDQMTEIEALVGIEQLKKYPNIHADRIKIKNLYFEKIRHNANTVFPPDIEGATYSHFVIRTPTRDKWLENSASNGIQLGQLIEYSMPHHPAYAQYTEPERFPNSLLCSSSMINLPIYPGLKNNDINKIISFMNKEMTQITSP